MEGQRKNSSVYNFFVILLDIAVISAIFATAIKGILNKAALEDFIMGGFLCLFIIVILAAINDVLLLGADDDSGFVLTFAVMGVIAFIFGLVVITVVIYLLFKWFKWLIA